MERGTKRKAAPPSTPATEGRASKRQKTPGDPHYVPQTGETVASTTEVGWKFIEHMKAARDKNNNFIATNFQTLPDKKQFPQYYETIELPIAIATLERKLERKEYATLTELESDVKRMVSNAKTFNETGSSIFQDAERIRKMTSNFMVKHNPAYKNKDYVAFPTPLPSELETKLEPHHNQRSITITKSATASVPPKTLKLTASAPARKKQVREKEEEEEEEEEERVEEEGDGEKEEEEVEIENKAKKNEEPSEVSDGSYKGKTFQEAQEQLVQEIMHYVEPESELEIFAPFANLPSRTLADYYTIIKQPLSLKGMQKRVRGIHGRHETTGVSDFKTWEAFETEFSKMWQNAREYNEDGSEMFSLSLDLERIFKKRFAEAKREVDEPSQPTLRLNLGAKPPPIKLKLGSAKPSPGPQRHNSGTPSASTPGITVDKAALQRQKELVQAGANGIKLVKPATTDASVTTQSPAPATVQPSTSRAGSAVEKSPPNINGVKPEAPQEPAGSILPTPTPNASNTSVPPVTAPPSSMPPPAQAISLPNGATTPALPGPQHVPYHAPPTGLDSKWRPDGNDASNALLSNLIVTTHPDPRTSKPLRVNIPAHPSLSQQSVTLTLPPSHTILRFQPTLHPSLFAYSSYLNPPPIPPNAATPPRPYKIFVTSNNQRVQPNPAAIAPTLTPATLGTPAPPITSTSSLPNGISNNSNPPHQPQPPSQSPPILKSPPNPVPPYDVKLLPGINRIDVEIVSPAPTAITKQPQAPAQNTRGAANGGLELEKVSVYVHLMRL